MKMKFLAVIIPAFFSLNLASADTVDQSAVTTFEDGTPAVAAEVNGNFQALIDAINDNAAAIAALESSSSSSNSVSGASFQLNQIGILNRGQTDMFATTANLSQQYTVVFNSDGNFTFDGTSNEGELNATTGSLIIQCDGCSESETGTWTQTGSSVSLSIGISFTVSADGNVIILSEFSTGTDGGADTSESSFLVGVRTN